MWLGPLSDSPLLLPVGNSKLIAGADASSEVKEFCVAQVLIFN